MSSDECTYLCYDKASGTDHRYENKFTKDMTVEMLLNSDHPFKEGIEAIKEFNKFGGIYVMDLGIDLDLYNIFLFSFKDKGIDHKYTIVSINNKKLEQCVKKNNIPNRDFLIACCRCNILYGKASRGISIVDRNSVDRLVTASMDSIIMAASKPNADLVDHMEAQPQFCTTTLYNYQKRNIKWMLLREKEQKGIFYGLNDETIIGNVVYNGVGQEFIMGDSRKQLVFSGGALIDEVGLGKTIQMIITCLLNPPPSNKMGWYQPTFPRLFSKATLVICPNQLVGQWTRELDNMINESYNLKVVPMFTKIHYDKYSIQDLLDADFVITSYTFLGNKCFLEPWVLQLDKSLAYIKGAKYNHDLALKLLNKLALELKENPSLLLTPNPNILLMHWHRIVVDEFHEVYTVSKYNYISKLLRLFQGTYKWCMTATPFDKSKDCLINMIDYVTNQNSPLNSQILINKPIEEHMTTTFFRRNTKLSVQDEYKLQPLKEHIVWLDFSPTEWMIYNAYVANPNIDKFSKLLRQICCHPKIADEIKGALSNCKTLEDIEKMMVKHYETTMICASKKVKYITFRIKNTQMKIKILEYKRQKRLLRSEGYKGKIEIKRNPAEEKEMQDLEKELNQDPDVQQFAAAVPYVDMNLDDDEEDKKDDKKIPILINDENQDMIKQVLGTKLLLNIPQNIENLKELDLHYQQKLVVLTKDFEGKQSTYNYFNDVMTRLRKTTTVKMSDKPPGNDSDSDSDDDDDSEQCGICLDKITGHDLGVTKCGHIFCYNCVKPFIQNQNKCPMCQKPCKSNEIYIIAHKGSEEEIKDSDFKDKQTLISKVGTKLANLIFFLKKNDKHTIVFSQWDDLLRNVGEVLNDYGIKNVFCKGHVWQRDKAIRDFQDKNDIKVIMLSSESAASGTNLTKAEMVIFLDPVYGPYEYRRNTEWQAIGRAYRMGQTKQVQVVRFIIKNTVEHEIYDLNAIEDKKLNIVTKLDFQTQGKDITLNEKQLGEMAADAVTLKKVRGGGSGVPKRGRKKKDVVVKDESESEDSDASLEAEPMRGPIGRKAIVKN